MLHFLGLRRFRCCALPGFFRGLALGHLLLLACLLLSSEPCRFCLRLALLHFLDPRCFRFGAQPGFFRSVALGHFLLLASLLLGGKACCFGPRLEWLHLGCLCCFFPGFLRGCSLTLGCWFGLVLCHLFRRLAGWLPGRLRNLGIRLGLLPGMIAYGVFSRRLPCHSGSGWPTGVVFDLA